MKVITPATRIYIYQILQIFFNVKDSSNKIFKYLMHKLSDVSILFEVQRIACSYEIQQSKKRNNILHSRAKLQATCINQEIINLITRVTVFLWYLEKTKIVLYVFFSSVPPFSAKFIKSILKEKTCNIDGSSSLPQPEITLSTQNVIFLLLNFSFLKFLS